MSLCVIAVMTITPINESRTPKPPAKRGGVGWSRFLLALLLIAACVLGALYLFSQGRTSRPPSPSPVGDDLGLVANVERRDITRDLIMTGDVAPSFEVEIKPEVGGKIKKIHVRVNDAVTRGQLIAEIDDSEYLTEKAGAEAEIEGARLRVHRAQRNFDRINQLRQRSLASQEEYDNLLADLSLAQNELDRSRRRLDLVNDKIRKTRIVAPADGHVLEVPVLEGQVVVAAASVNSGTTLVRIANLSKLLVKTHINQIDAASLVPGQDAALSSEALPDAKMRGIVRFIAPVATSKNNIKGFEVKLEIVDPNDRLRPGMTLNVVVPVEKVEGVIAVPIAAVFQKPGGKSSVAYVTGGEGRRDFEERAIVPGVADLFFVQVRSGLKEGERVLLFDPTKMDDLM